LSRDTSSSSAPTLLTFTLLWDIGWDWNLPGLPSCRQQILELFSLHNHGSQPLTISIYLYIGFVSLVNANTLASEKSEGISSALAAGVSPQHLYLAQTQR
jgi:hypothetical protein